MNERQQALLAYVATIARHVRGYRSVDDLTDRVFSCVKQDIGAVAINFAKFATEKVLPRAGAALGEALGDELGKSASRFVSSFFKNKRGR